MESRGELIKTNVPFDKEMLTNVETHLKAALDVLLHSQGVLEPIKDTCFRALYFMEKGAMSQAAYADKEVFRAYNLVQDTVLAGYDTLIAEVRKYLQDVRHMRVDLDEYNTATTSETAPENID